MLEHQFYVRVVLNVILGVIFAYSLYRMAVYKNREVAPKKHFAIKIVGGIFALLCCFEIVLFVIYLRQIDFPISMNEPFIDPNAIIRSADKLLIWGQATYIQNMALTQSVGIFTSLGIAAYCFMFKSSFSKWYSKLGKFFLGAVLYALYASSTDFHYFDFWELVPIGLFLVVSIYVISRKDKAIIKDNDGTVNSIISEMSSFEIVNISTETKITEKKTIADANMRLQEVQENKKTNDSQRIDEHDKSSNNKYKWKPLLFILSPVFSCLMLIVLWGYFPRNESKSFKGWLINEIRIGNFKTDGNYTSETEDVKIAKMKYYKRPILESDQDESWQHSILHKFFRYNNDEQSKFYGEQITLWIYDVSSDIRKSNYTESEYYKYLANQIKSSNILIENTDSINNGVLISSQTGLSIQDDDNASYFFKVIYVLTNERVYRFNFIQDGELSKYPKGEDIFDTIDKRFMSIIDRIDFSSYQQWKDNEERVEKSRPYYKFACILLALVGFLFPLLGIRKILNNVGNDNPRANTICKIIYWFTIVVSLVEYAATCLFAIGYYSEKCIEIPLGIMICHIIISILLFVLAFYYKTKSHTAIEQPINTNVKQPWGKILQKIVIYPFAIIAALLYSCKEQFMEIFNNYRNKNN